MEFKRCERCGAFFTSINNVCERCTPKDNLEFQRFQNYINQNGNNESLQELSINTGISTKNLNRFLNINL